MNTTNTLHIFRSGTQTAMSGETLNFSAADLAATANAYDPAKHEAPIVIGHPEHDAPAWGWVKTLRAEKDDLEAEPKQVDPKFAEIVKAGRYKKISASFYSPTSPNNPVPGVYYLRHVGFLGAQPPAVKGLQQASFAANETGIVEFSEELEEENMLRQIYNWLISKFGGDINQLIASPPIDAPDPETNETTLPTVTTEEINVNEEEKAALLAENQQLKTQVEELLKKIEELTQVSEQVEEEQIEEEAAEFAESLIVQGKLVPRDKHTVVSTYKSLAPTRKLNFGEHSSRKKALDVFKSALQNAPSVVSFSEHATKGKAGTAGYGGRTEFSEKLTDPARMALHQSAENLSRVEGISYEQALNRIRNI